MLVHKIYYSLFMCNICLYMRGYSKCDMRKCLLYSFSKLLVGRFKFLNSTVFLYLIDIEINSSRSLLYLQTKFSLNTHSIYHASVYSFTTHRLEWYCAVGKWFYYVFIFFFHIPSSYRSVCLFQNVYH